MIEIFHSLKCEDFINELGKTYSIGEKGMFPKEFCPYHKIFGQKGPENIYL